MTQSEHDQAVAEWQAKYKARVMFAAGLTEHQATLVTMAAEIDLSTDPEEAADEEISCWENDDPDE